MASQWRTDEPRLEETKRTARLLQIMLMIAAAPHRYCRRDLAVRFEVTPRMISKDIELISNITGFNLQSGRDGTATTKPMIRNCLPTAQCRPGRCKHCCRRC